MVPASHPHRLCGVTATAVGHPARVHAQSETCNSQARPGTCVRNAAALDLGEAMSVYGDAGAVEVVVTRLDVGPDALRASVALLSQEERQRAGRFVFDRDRRRFIVARSRLRQLLAARLGGRSDAVELVYGDSGKPALARRVAGPDLRFNVSPCDGGAGYAFSM